MKKMIDAFKEGVQSKGHRIDVVDVCRKQIGGCLACEYCHTKGKGVCVQKDDMQEVYELLNQAELLVPCSLLREILSGIWVLKIWVYLQRMAEKMVLLQN